MDTQKFLDYLDEHTVTRDLAAEVAELLAARRSLHRIGATRAAPATDTTERIAS